MEGLESKSVAELIGLQKELGNQRVESDAQYREQMLEVQAQIDAKIAAGERNIEVLPEGFEDSTVPTSEPQTVSVPPIRPGEGE